VPSGAVYALSIEMGVLFSVYAMNLLQSSCCASAYFP